MTGSNDSDSKKEPELNIFRDTLVRYLGYTNEVGESFRYQYPRFVIPSYIISFGYCCADAGSTGWSVYQKNQEASQASIYTLDTLLWQSLASVMIPGAIINMIVRSVKAAVNPTTHPAVARWGPTAVGLGSIPLIIHPIDTAVDLLLDSTLRPLYFKKEEER